MIVVKTKFFIRVLHSLLHLKKKITSGNLSLYYWGSSHKFSICWHNSGVASNTTEMRSAIRNSGSRITQAYPEKCWTHFTALRFLRTRHLSSLFSLGPIPSVCSPSHPIARTTCWGDAAHCLSPQINGMPACTCSSQPPSRCTLPGRLGTGEATERGGFISLFPITVLHPKPFLLTFSQRPWKHQLTAECNHKATFPVRRESRLTLTSVVTFKATERYTLEPSYAQLHITHA